MAHVEGVRHAMLELHRRLIDAQRIQYEKLHGRVETASEFLGLVLAHGDFEWIRLLSALMAQLDEWRESERRDPAELDAILAALRQLLQKDGPNAEFSRKYWEMVEGTPAVLIDHVKLTRILG